jgi:hypothetical protein
MKEKDIGCVVRSSLRGADHRHLDQILDWFLAPCPSKVLKSEVLTYESQFIAHFSGAQ